MTQPLIMDACLSMEKVSHSTRLEKEPEEWATEIVSQAYRQLPFLQPLETDLELDKVDRTRGYAIGKLSVYPMGLQKQAALEQDKMITIPIIVRDKDLSPLDVYAFRGKMFPIEEEKIASIFLQPQLLDMPMDPRDLTGGGFSAQITPPDSGRTNGTMPISKTASLMKTAQASFREEDVNRLKETLRTDHVLRLHALSNDTTRNAIGGILADAKEKTASDMKKARRADTKPSVVQFVEEGTGYVVKTANHKAWNPSETRVTRFEAQRVLPPETMAGLLANGFVTLVPEPMTEGGVVKQASVADRTAVYKTYAGPVEVTGLVLPRMITIDGEVMEHQVLLGGKEHALQEKVAGVHEQDVRLPVGTHPRGKGVFVYQRGEFSVALEPVDVLSEVTVGPEKLAHLACKRLLTGEDVKIRTVPGLQKLAHVGNEVLLPEGFIFLRLNGKQVTVASDPIDVNFSEMRKVAGVTAVRVISDGSLFALRGDTAKVFADGMTMQEAEFALGGLGVHGTQARDFLKTAAQHGSVVVPRTRYVISESDAQQEHFVKAAHAFASVPKLRVGLLKEATILANPVQRVPAAAFEAVTGFQKTAASVIIDKETVDSILALDFITPENVSIYTGFIPDLEKISSHLAEILIASRLGMDNVREHAAKSAMNNISSVLDGLRKLDARIR